MTIENRYEGKGGGNDVDVYNKNTDYSNTRSQNNSDSNAIHNQSDARNINEADENSVINEQNDIENGDGMEYKGVKGIYLITKKKTHRYEKSVIYFFNLITIEII